MTEATNRSTGVPADVHTVLVVDRDYALVQFAREELTQTDGVAFRLLHAKTPEEVAHVCAGERLTAVLVDCKVLSVDVEWLRDLRGARHVPVIAVVTDEDERRAWTATGEVDTAIIRASVDGQALATSIQRARARAQARSDVLHTPAHLEALVQHSNDLIFVVNDSGRCEYESPTVACLLGGDTQSRRELQSWVHPEDAGLARRLVNEAACAKTACHGTLRMLLASGAMATFSVTASRMRAHRRTLVVLNALLHGTDRKVLMGADQDEATQPPSLGAMEDVVAAVASDLGAMASALAAVDSSLLERSGLVPLGWDQRHRLQACSERVALLRDQLLRHRHLTTRT